MRCPARIEGRGRSVLFADAAPTSRPRGSKTKLSPLVDGVHEFAVHVELELTGSCVATTHRRGTLVAG
jgi:hypothetical protein